MSRLRMKISKKMIKKKPNADSIPNISLMAGMASKSDIIIDLFRTGFISYTALGLNSSVRYVGVLVIGDAEHLRSIFKNGDTLMG